MLSNAPSVLVLATGSRDWDDYLAIDMALSGIQAEFPHHKLVLFEGEAQGADRIARESIKSRLRWKVKKFPADWGKYGRVAGPRRNAEMLEALINQATPEDEIIVLAFKNKLHPQLAKGGTEDMIRRCKAANIPVYLIGRL